VFNDVLALDLRALRVELDSGLDKIISEELSSSFGISCSQFAGLVAKIRNTMRNTMDKTATMDAADQMKAVADSATLPLVDFFTSSNAVSTSAYTSIPTFRSKVASRSTHLLQQLRVDFISGARGATPAAPYLGRTRGLYEFVRSTLGIRTHGVENLSGFANGLGNDDVTIGQNISTIYEVSYHPMPVTSFSL
jgi:phenylalanine ammonia-lyase